MFPHSRDVWLSIAECGRGSGEDTTQGCGSACWGSQVKRWYRNPRSGRKGNPESRCEPVKVFNRRLDRTLVSTDFKKE